MLHTGLCPARYSLSAFPFLSSSITLQTDTRTLAYHPTTMRFLEQVHNEACRTRPYSPRTEQACLRSLERICRFHPRMRAGHFPANPACQACLYCPYRSICPRGEGE